MKIVYFGTPAIAANVLDELLKHNIEVIAVVTKPDKPQGRSQKTLPCAVKELVLNSYPHIPVLQPLKVSTEEYKEKLEAFNADLFVVVAYGEIIKQNILDVPPLGCINVHASLLPKYRGAAPMHRAIISGEKETGVTIMEMVLALDAGAVLHVEKIPITEFMNVGDLEKIMEKIGFEALVKTLTDLKSKRASKTEQDESLVTYASKITPEECEIHWGNSSKKIHDLIRGVTPFPGAWCKIFFDREPNLAKRLKIKKSCIVENSKTNLPGSIIKYDKDGWILSTLDGAIALLEVQLEGKKPMSAPEFFIGYPKVKFTQD